jgi:CRISPR/Cas system-associated exonuclease Cas4 (RecB family)
MDPIVRIYKQRDEEGRERARNYRIPAQRFRASELADCKRKMWYRKMGYVPKPDTGFAMDWSIDGDLHHDVIRQVMLDAGIELAGITRNEDGTTEEDMFTKHTFLHDGQEIVVSTRQDGWIKHDDYGWMLMEIKTVSHWKYKYMHEAYLKGGHDGVLEYLQEKYRNYIYQMHAGLAIAKAQGPKALPFDPSEKHTLDHAYLVIKDRSNCHMGFHDEERGVLGGVIMPYSDDTWNIVLNRCAQVSRKRDENVPPRPDYTSSAAPCQYCDYRYACHDAEKRRRKGLRPAVVYPDPAVGLEFLEEDTSG